VSDGLPPRSTGPQAGRVGWIPVPATLLTVEGATTGIVSWDPIGHDFPSLTAALSSPEARRNPPDLVSQARYYLECTLAKLHGVRFGPCDSIEDEAFALSPEILALDDSFKRLEQVCISNPKLGLLDRFG